MCLVEAKKVGSCSRDAINSLPDEILAQILSLLPTKRAVSTSILSKRWRNVFPLVNHLFASQHHHLYLDDSDLLDPDESKKSFSKRNDVRQSFRDFVGKTLYGCNTIKKLTLKCQDDRTSVALTDEWIRMALERGLVDLDLRLRTTVRDEALWLRSHTVFRNKTLVKLTLGIEIYAVRIWFPLKEPVFLPVLKSLIIHGVWFRLEQLYNFMLPGCPVLDELSLQYSYQHYAAVRQYCSPISISHKTLKRLTVHFNSCCDRSRSTRFDTPSLVYLDYSGHAPLPCCNLVDASSLDSLVEAKLDVYMTEQQRAWRNCLPTIINWMSNVNILSLSCTSVKEIYSSGTVLVLPYFVNLVKLSIENDTKQGWQVLPSLLNKSPKLETLVLKGLHCVRNEVVEIGPSEVKVLEIYGFRGSRGEFRQFERFLRQMHFLQVMKVEIDARGNKKLKLVSEILALPKHSSECQIQFL